MILLALGGNLGDRKANLEQALALLGHGDDAPLRITRVSSVYETAALLPEDAPEDWDIPYYNIVLAAETALAPEELLRVAKATETHMGRKDIGRWGPRIIDIDILAYDHERVVSESLTLPHPAMLERDFVMLPLAEILPHWQHPDHAEEYTAHMHVQERGMTLGEGILRVRTQLHWETH